MKKYKGTAFYLLLTFQIILFSVGLMSCSKSSESVMLKAAISHVNSECPMEVDEVTTMVNMTDDGDFVTYNMSVSPGVVLEDGNDFVNQMKIYTSEGFKEDENILQFLDLVVKNGKGLRYRYTLLSDNKIYDVDFSNIELKNIIK